MKAEIIEGHAPKIVQIKDMEPGDIGALVDQRATRKGALLLCANSYETHMVIELGRCTVHGACWTGGTSSYEVALLPKGSKVTLTVE